MTIFGVRRIWWVCLILLVMVEAAGLAYLKALPYSRIEVINTSQLSDLYWNPRQSPNGIFRSPGGVVHKLVGAGYAHLEGYRSIIPAEILPQEKVRLIDVVRLRQWSRKQFRYSRDLGGFAMFDYKKTLSLRKPNGVGGLCDAFVTFFVGSALSVGIPARVVHLLAQDGGGHYVAEAWVDEFQKWVMMDVLENTMYYVEGKPASAFEVRRALFHSNGRGRPRLERHGASFPKIAQERISNFRHVLIVNRADFGEYGISFFGKKLLYVHLVDSKSSPLGEMERVLRPLTLILLPGFLLANIGMIAFNFKRKTMRRIFNEELST